MASVPVHLAGHGQVAMNKTDAVGWELARTCQCKCEPWKTGGDYGSVPLGVPPLPESREGCFGEVARNQTEETHKLKNRGLKGLQAL